MNLGKFVKVATLIRSNQWSYLKSGACARNCLYYLGPKYGHGSVQYLSTSTVQTKDEESPGILKKLLSKVPLPNFNKNRLMASGYLLYEEIADRLNYAKFFEELDLPDTFYSWFVITELHVWMLSVRIMAEGDEGRFIRNHLIEALWADVAERVKHLGVSNTATTRSQIEELSYQLQAALIAYDEGLQSDDMVLAGALWRRFYQHADVDPEQFNTLISYVRKQVVMLEGMSKADLLKAKSVKWIPLTN